MPGWRSGWPGWNGSSVAGEFMANMIANAAQYERRLIGQRTSAAMQAKRQAGATFGRPDRVPAEVVARVVAERAAGRSLAAIAAGLDADEVPTAPRGRRRARRPRWRTARLRRRPRSWRIAKSRAARGDG